MADNVPDEKLWSWIDDGSPELEAHLDEHPEDRERVDALRGAVAQVAVGSETPRRRVPERIGDYEILGVLGEGGMGVVYEARQQSPRRVVALKVLRHGLAARPAELRLLRREAQALARLTHPGIAAIYGGGEARTGEPFFVMERVNGAPLDKHVALLGDDVRRKIELFIAICDAVDYAHNQGVIHRDLKPSNVIVDADGMPKVLDFGLARIADPGEHEPTFTATRIVGTVPYMSPEQTRGTGGDLDRRSDVYALGVLLFEALAGQLPYDLDGLAFADAISTIRNAPPVVPRRSRRAMRGDIETIVRTALAKEPGRRYDTAAALAEDLRRVLDGRPILARPAGRMYRTRKFVGRHPIATTIVVALLVVLGFAVTIPAGMNLDAEMDSGGWLYPERSPFDAVRWDGDDPIVLVNGEWWELEEINGIRAGLIVEYTRHTAGPWRKRFSEDLTQVMAKMGERPGRSVELTLRDRETSELVRLRDVPNTDSKRSTVWWDRHSMPWDSVRVSAGAVEVKIAGEYYELLSIEGTSIDELSARANAHRPPYMREHESLLSCLSEHDHLIAVLGSSLPDPTLLGLRHLASGEIIESQPFPRVALPRIAQLIGEVESDGSGEIESDSSGEIESDGSGPISGPGDRE